MDAPYKTGDFIILDTGERGVVTHIGLRSTRLLTRDDVEVTIPNGVIGNGKIINEAGGPSEKHRIRVSVGVAYGSDIDHVIATLEQVAADNAEVCADPAPRVRFRTFGESSLDFQLLCWIERPVDRGRVNHELNCSVYRAFIDNNIEIPFPQRDLHVRTMPDRA
jgi:small-conductance mechanosensitive channel